MDLNETQGRWLIGAGLASQDDVAKAWDAIAASGEEDLCGVLEGWGQLSRAQAGAIREAIAQGAPPSTVSGDGRIIGPARGEMIAPAAPSALSGTSSGGLISSLEGAASVEARSAMPALAEAGYDIEGVVGRGGMGSVWRCRRRATGDEVVVKLMIEAQDPRARERFSREARALAQLRHPNIVKVIDYRAESRPPFMVLELVEGENLRDLVRERVRSEGQGLELDECAEVFACYADALAVCHARGLTHRDIKPDNLLIEAETGRPVVLDFGVVRFDAEEGLESLTRTGQLVGTPRYMALEQLEPDEDEPIGPPADIWSLGATLHYALLGVAPYHEADSVVSLVKARMAKDVGSLRASRKDIPAALDDLALRMLARSPAERPEAAQVAMELRELLGRLDASEAPSEPKAPARVGLWTFTGVIALALLGAGLWFASLWLAPIPLVPQVSFNGEFSAEVWSRQAEVLLQLREPAGWVKGLRVDGERIIPFEGGRCDLSIPMTAAERTLRLEVIDGFGRAGEPRELLLHYDPDAPQVTLEPLDLLTLRVRGEVSEACEELRVGGQVVALTGRSFEAPLPTTLARGGVEVEARDRAGNVGSATLRARVVGPGGTHATLTEALADLPEGGRIALRPGRHEWSGELPAKVGTIGGAGVTLALPEAGLGVRVRGGDWTLKGLHIERPAGSREVALELVRGRLRLEGCELRGGQTHALSARGPKRGDGMMPVLEMERCVLSSQSLEVLSLAHAAAWLESVRVEGPATGILRDIRGSIEAAGSRLEARDCDISGGLNGVVAINSRVRLRGGKIRGCASFGMLTNAAVLDLREVEFTSNGVGGVNAGVGSRGLFERCRFLRSGAAGSHGTGVVSQTDSRLRLVDCEVRDNAKEGVVAVLNSQVAMSGCELTGNGERPVWLDRGSVIRASRCRFESPAGALFQVQEASQLAFEDCAFRAPQGSRATVVGGSKLTVLRCRREQGFEVSLADASSEASEDWSEPRAEPPQGTGTVTVDAGGSGDFTDIGAAIAALERVRPSPGRLRILLRPGTYEATLEMTEDLIIEAEGPPGSVTIQAKGGRLLALSDAAVKIIGVTLEKGPTKGALAALKVIGRGSLELERCVIRSVDGSCITMEGDFRRGPTSNHPGPMPELRMTDCELYPAGYGGVMLYDATAILKGCKVIDERAAGPDKRPNIAVKQGSFAALEDCELTGSRLMGLRLEGGHVTVSGGLISGSSGAGLSLDPGDAIISGLRFEGNAGGPTEVLSGGILSRR